MKYILAMIAGLMMSTSVLAEECTLPEGCDWRTSVIIMVEKEGVENWTMEWNSPRMDFNTNVRHNYLLLEHIFGRDKDESETKLMGIVRQLGPTP